MLELDIFILGIAFLFFILGVLCDRGKAVWYGLAMVLFLVLSGTLATFTQTQIVENPITGQLTAVEVPVSSARRWWTLCFGMFWLSFLFFILTVWDVVRESLRR